MASRRRRAAGPAGPQGPNGRLNNTAMPPAGPQDRYGSVTQPNILVPAADNPQFSNGPNEGLQGLDFAGLEKWYQQQIKPQPIPGVPVTPPAVDRNSNQFLQTFTQNRNSMIDQHNADAASGAQRVDAYKQGILTRSNASAVTLSAEMKPIKNYSKLSSVQQRALLTKWGAKDLDQLNLLGNNLQSLIDASIKGNVNSAYSLNNVADLVTASHSQQAATLATQQHTAQVAKDNQSLWQQTVGYAGGAIDSLGKAPNLLAQAVVTPIEMLFRTGDSSLDATAQGYVTGLRDMKNDVAGTVEKGFSAFTVSAYAWENAMLQGADSTTRARAFLGGLPGLGFTAGTGDARKYIEQVNTRIERSDMTKDGRLLSIGQYFGGYGGNLRDGERERYVAMFAQQHQFLSPYKEGGGFFPKPNTPESAKQEILKSGKGDIRTGLIDATFTILQDPTVWAGGPKGSLGEWAVKSVATKGLTEAEIIVASQAARLAVIGDTELGDNVLRRLAAKLAMRNINHAEVLAAVGGLKQALDPEMVNNIVRAMSAGGEVILRDGTTAAGEHAIRMVLVDAFVEGTWDPKAGLLKRFIIHNSGKVAETLPEWAVPKGSVFYRAKQALTGIASHGMPGIEGNYVVTGREAILQAMHLGAAKVQNGEGGFISQILEDFTLHGAPAAGTSSIDGVLETSLRDLISSVPDEILVFTKDEFDVLWQTGNIPQSVTDRVSTLLDSPVGDIFGFDDLTHNYIVRLPHGADNFDGLSWLVPDTNNVGRWVGDTIFEVGPAASGMGKKQYAEFVAAHVADMGDTVTRLGQLAELIDSPALQHYVSRLGLMLDNAAFESLNPEVALLLTETLQEAELLARMIAGDYDHLGNISETTIQSLSRYYNPTAVTHGVGITGRRASIGSIVEEAHLFRSSSEWIDQEGLGIYEAVTDDELAQLADEIVKLYGPDSHVATYFTQAAKSKSLLSRTTAANAMDMILSDSQFGERLVEEVSVHQGRRAAYARMAQVLEAQKASNGLAQRIPRGAAKFALSLVEKAPGKILRGLISPNAAVNIHNIVEFVDNYAASLYLTREERALLTTRAVAAATDIAAGGSMKPLDDLIHGLYAKIWDRQGLGAGALKDWEEQVLARRIASQTGKVRGEIYRVELTEEQLLAYNADPKSLRILKNGTATIGGVEVVLALDPSVASQIDSTIRVLSLRDLQEGIRNELMHNGDATFGQKVRVIVSDRAVHFQWENKAAQLVLRGNSIAEVSEKLFKFWKVMVTTRLLYGPIAGTAALVYLGQDGEIDTNDLWHALAIGGSLAMFGPTRYRARMSFQNRLDAYLEHGFVAREQIPGLAALYRRQERDIYGIAVHALSTDPNAATWITWREGLLHAPGEWSIVTDSSSHLSFVAGYDRILNAQLSPELDEMTRIFLRHPLGTQGVFGDTVVALDVALRDEIDQFLATNEGVLWAGRMEQAGHTADEAIEQTRRFVQTYAWDEDVAAARLASMGPGSTISRTQIEEWVMEGKLSPAIHAQTLDKSVTASALGRLWKRTYENMAYGTTAAPGFKESVFAVERARIEKVLVNRGVPLERARDISIATATLNTNKILFRYDNATRFAHAADWFAPFTGHKQFNAYMWTKLALENPRNAISLTAHAAQAFNAGKDSGILTKDQFGSWRFVVPGSARLSKLLGVDVSTDMSAPVLGFLAVGSDVALSQGHGASALLSYTEQFTPHLGGPVWTYVSGKLAHQYPDFFNPATTPLPDALYNFLWPMGVQDNPLLPEDAQVWVSLITTSLPPFLMINEQGIEKANQIRVLIARELVAKHARELADAGLPPDPHWFEGKDFLDKVHAQFLSVMTVSSFLRAVSPSAPSMKFPQADRAQASFELWKKWNPKMSFSEQRRTFLVANPEMYPYVVFGTTTRTDNTAGTYKEWALPHANDLASGQYAWDRFEGTVHYKNMDQFTSDMKVYADRTAYGAALAAANKIPSSTDREAELARIRAKYPEQAAYFRDKKIMEEDLAAILLSTPEGIGREVALNRWRTQWADNGYKTVSHDTYVTMERNIRNNIALSPTGQYQLSYATHARYGEEVYKDVMDGRKSVWLDNGVLDPAILWEVATLNPAEQTRFWTHARVNMWVGDSGGDSSAITARDKLLKQQISEIYNNPKYTAGLRYSSTALVRDGDYSSAILAKKEKGRNTISALYTKLGDVSASKQAAYTSKSWGEYTTLKAQETALYGEISAFKNDLFANKDVSIALHEAIAEYSYVEQVGSRAAKKKAYEKLKGLYQNSPLEPVDEQAGYDNLNIQQKVAWQEDLVNALNLPPEDARAAGDLKRSGLQLRTKLYWEYLTAFQKATLENTYSHKEIAAWKLITPGMGKKATTSIAGNEIAFAYAMLKKYDQRNGLAKPPNYAEYLALPPSSALRSEFIKNHPLIATYLRLGGLANMPPAIRGIVTDIMIRNGKWGGEEKTINEITDIAFARQQLQTYSKRGDRTRPDTFDQWLRMPSGPERAAYMSSHPEVGQWVSDGPMANMPTYYRDVVRDIMYRYNEWTTSAASDGIGGMMTEFFKVPAYARTDYLTKHPDLAAYFHASKSPDEQALQEKLNVYYAIPDTNARKTFLQVHPEVQQYMLTSRHDRYVRFLQQTSMFLSQNPEVFQKYLDNQDEVMKDLLAKFSEPYLVQETQWSGTSNINTVSSEGGRKRGK